MNVWLLLFKFQTKKMHLGGELYGELFMTFSNELNQWSYIIKWQVEHFRFEVNQIKNTTPHFGNNLKKKL